MRALHFLFAMIVLGAPAAHSQEGLLSPADRMRLTRLLLPADPGFKIHNLLPGADILTPTQLADNYREMQNLAYVGGFTWKDLAVNYILRSQFDLALDCLRRLEPRQRSDLNTRIIEAWLYERTGQIHEAMLRYGDLAEQFGGQDVLVFRKACCELHLFQTRAVRESVARMRQVVSDNADVRHLEGLMAFQQGDFAEAHAVFIKISTEHPDDMLVESKLALALIFLHERMIVEAVGWLNIALQKASPADRYRLIHLPEWRHIETTAPFLMMLQHHGYAYNPATFEVEAIQKFESEGARFYAEKFRVPESLRVSLHLREFEPFTRVRTMQGHLDAELAEEETQRP
jgi:tetratricopeptide (TPR) repeat protein